MRIHENDSQALVLTDVCHSFGDGENAKQVLFDNSLRLDRGEIVVLTGPSGSGKTTLLTLIGALRSIQSGSIRFDGKELAGMTAKQQVETRRKIGFIFQAHNLFDALNARQNVRMALELTDLSVATQNARAKEILERVGLAERIDYKPAKLSGGQRQRVAICRALVNEPSLVLADEPTAALDKETGANVLNMLRELASKNGAIVIIVSHDSRVISSADRMINMIDGRIVSDVRVKETAYVCQKLKACSLFEKMSLSDLADVAQKMEQRIYDAGEVVFKQGELGDTFFLISEGQVAIDVNTEGTNKHVATLAAGDFFGEVALLKEQPRNATVTAQSDLTVYCLSKSDFLKAVDEHQSFDNQLYGAISARS